MRVLFLTEVLHPETVGGSGRYARDLGEALVRRGHEVCILTRNPGRRLLDHEHRAGLQIVRYRVPQSAVPWLPAVQMWSARRAAAALANRFAFDVVHAQQPLVAAAALGVPELSNRPFIYTFQSAWHEEYLIKRGKMRPGEVARPSMTARAMRGIEKNVIHRAERVIVLSSYSKERVQELHAPPASITAIPGGVDLSHFQTSISRAEARRKLGLREDGTWLFTARNLVPRMGLENLIDAVARLSSTHPDLRLVIAGGGALAPALRSQASKLGLSERIVFAGRVDESSLALHYRAADLFVLPTAQIEGFGLVTVEALASGTPVVATPVGGSLDILSSFHERSLADGIDAEALASRIGEFLSDRDAWPDSQSCRNYAERHFGWGQIAQSTEQIYQHAIFDHLRREPDAPLDVVQPPPNEDLG